MALLNASIRTRLVSCNSVPQYRGYQLTIIRGRMCLCIGDPLGVALLGCVCHRPWGLLLKVSASLPRKILDQVFIEHSS
jgi:hypothetical protein